ncbi:MAG TPA: hypothetical protein VNX68_17225 [Nitrosopumilaceae archaeon]|jgi:hypothetical protein|nr:hypothetical protein [Nitrosopumilaceae archaeon]
MENYSSLLPVLLIGFLIYRRVQRTIGFQKYSPNRLKFRIGLLSIIAIVLLVLTFLHPISLISDGLGIILGLVLVYFAIKNTIFDNRVDGLFYRTHIWIELTVLFLFFARLIYRFYQMSVVMEKVHSGEQMSDKLNDIRNPLTAVVLFIMCTYYISYFLFVLKQAKAELLNERK